MEVDVEKLKRDWTGFTFDTAEFEVNASDLVSFASACGETGKRYTDPADPDFQAVPNYTSRYVGRRILPDSFPRLGSGYGFDAGKCVTPIAPIRPGDFFVNDTATTEIYTKTGRSGTMLFIVHRMEFSNQRGEPVSVVAVSLKQKKRGAR